MGFGSLSKFDDLFGGGVEQYLPMLPVRAVKDKLPEEIEVHDGFKWFKMTKDEFLLHCTHGVYDLVVFPDGTIGLASNFGNYYTSISIQELEKAE